MRPRSHRGRAARHRNALGRGPTGRRERSLAPPTFTHTHRLPQLCGSSPAARVRSDWPGVHRTLGPPPPAPHPPLSPGPVSTTCPPGSLGGQALFTGPSLAQGARVPSSWNCQASGLQCRSGCHEPRGPACHGSPVQGLNKPLAKAQCWPVSAGRAVASVQALGVLAGCGGVPQATRWSCPEPAKGDPSSRPQLWPPPSLNKAPATDS